MAEQLIPPWIVPEDETQEWLDEGSSVFAAEFAPGLAQRQSYGGLRLKLSRKHTVRLEEKAQLLSILKSTKGRYNSLRTKVHFALRGSFSASELLTNNTFSNGTTGWSASGGLSPTLTSADRIARLTLGLGSIGGGAVLAPSSAVNVTQYAPHVLRGFLGLGRGIADANGFLRAGTIAGNTEYGGASANSGLSSLVVTPYAATLFPSLGIVGVSGNLSGDYFVVPYISLSRCPLVDNGSNLLPRSDELDNASWTKTRASITANSSTAPDGTVTGDSIIEDATAGNTHQATRVVSVSSAQSDYCFTVALKANTRTWAQILLTEATGSTSASAYFNLSNGAVGTATTGANFSNLRTFSTDMGNGWYQVAIVTRKTNAATSITCGIRLATGDTLSSYNGDGASLIIAWRATLAQSSVPVRLVQTTTTASTGTSQTGSALYLKGLPVSTNGLLLPEDFFEINGELKQCTAALNSDAAGLGYLQFEPGLIRSPADNDPVIITDPMGKFLVSNLKVDNEFGTQAIVTYDLEHIYE